jgi:histone arginine demethylase JMJD6
MPGNTEVINNGKQHVMYVSSMSWNVVASIRNFPPLSITPHDISKGIPIFHVSGLSKRKFKKEYEDKEQPCIIQGITDDWPATRRWTLKKLRKRYSDSRMKCGEDDDGYSVRVRMQYFLDYMANNKDDSPLYVFEGAFDDDKIGAKLLEDYTVPHYFDDDLFKYVKEKRRPPYRWFLIGPKRSGTTVHVDPLGTSAWNSLLVGRKRWVLFPPEAGKRLSKGRHHMAKGDDDEASNYFSFMLPKIRKEAEENGIKVYEFIQEPGETVFIPGGWWHSVINITDTIAVTQNFCSYSNFPMVWRETRVGRKKMCWKWLEKMKKEEPELALRAEAINAEDGFEMTKKESKKKKRSRSPSSEEEDKENTMTKKKKKSSMM